MSRFVQSLVIGDVTPNTFLRADANGAVISGPAEINLGTNATGLLPTEHGGLGIDLSSVSGTLSVNNGVVSAGILPVESGGTGAASFSASALLTGNGNGAITSTGIVVDGNNNVSGVEDLSVLGSLMIGGVKTMIESSVLTVDSPYVVMNTSHSTPNTSSTGGLVVNWQTTSITDAVTVGGFSATTVTTSGSATFSTGDFVLISGAGNALNDGVFEVASHVGQVLTIDTSSEYGHSQFIVDATASGAIIKVNLAVLRVNSEGEWEMASGSSSLGLAFKAIGSASGEVPLSSTLQTTDATPTTLINIPLVDGTSNLLEIKVVQRNVTAGTSGSLKIECAYDVAAGVVTKNGGDASTLFSASAITVAQSIDGQSVDLNVTGVAAQTIEWKVIVKVVHV